MALRLSRVVDRPRRIEVGYGVAMSFRPMSYAAYKEVEAAALRLARERLPIDMAAEVEAVDDDDIRPEVEDRLRGEAAAQLVRMAMLRFGESWEGLEDETGAPAPMTPETVSQFLELFPGVASFVHQALLAPFQELRREGNASAPSQGTA